MRDEIYWMVTATLRPGKLDEFKDVVVPLVAATREEEGSLAYDYSVDEAESGIWIFESYRDSAAVVHHVTTTFAGFADAFGACVDITGFTVFGRPEPEAKAILDGFGSTYLLPFEGFTASSPTA